MNSFRKSASCVFASLLCAMILLCIGGGVAEATSFSIPEYVLLGDEFSSSAWGGSVVRTDAPGSLVQFSFSGLGSGSTGLKDDYPVGPDYGQILPSHANGDFSNFDSYALWATNIDDQSVWMGLFINSGFTGPSGTPSNDPGNDTFWQTAWLELDPGVRTLLYLDFDDAIPYHVEDNPLPHTQGGTDGVAMVINPYDRTELDAIGFHVYSNENEDAAILVETYTPIPEPATLALMAVAFLAMVFLKTCAPRLRLIATRFRG